MLISSSLAEDIIDFSDCIGIGTYLIVTSYMTNGYELKLPPNYCLVYNQSTTP